jgi:hypothetical protein
LFGAFFLLETFFGSGTSLIQIGGQRHFLFKELENCIRRLIRTN